MGVGPIRLLASALWPLPQGMAMLLPSLMRLEVPHRLPRPEEPAIAQVSRERADMPRCQNSEAMLHHSFTERLASINVF